LRTSPNVLQGPLQPGSKMRLPAYKSQNAARYSRGVVGEIGVQSRRTGFTRREVVLCE